MALHPRHYNYYTVLGSGINVDDLENICKLGLDFHVAFECRGDIDILYSRLIDGSNSSNLDTARQGRGTSDHFVQSVIGVCLRIMKSQSLT
jgi:hypothetical protein